MIDKYESNLKDLPIDDLQSLIDSNRRIVGAYILYLNGDPVYVGSSVHVASRVTTHLGDSEKNFDSVKYFKCPSFTRFDYEALFIIKYDPPLNKALPSNSVMVAVGKAKKMVIEDVTDFLNVVPSEYSHNYKYFYKKNIDILIEEMERALAMAFSRFHERKVCFKKDLGLGE